ncbi:MAG: hypothetical protein WCA35_26080 [Kovacikia sp.]
MKKVGTQSNATEKPTHTQAQPHSPLVIISRIWQSWMHWLTNLGDIQVRQKVDRFGNFYWQAYSPLTGRSMCSGSELEIRMWIEQQLYQ